MRISVTSAGGDEDFRPVTVQIESVVEFQALIGALWSKQFSSKDLQEYADLAYNVLDGIRLARDIPDRDED